MTPPEGDRRLLGMALAAVLVLGLLLLAQRGLESEARTNPDFCRQCHTVRLGASVWTEDAHQKLACQECHEVTQEDFLRMMASFVATGTTSPHSRRDESVRCGACHLGTRRDLEAELIASPGHRQHSGIVGCTACHGSRTHRIVEPDAGCGACHENSVAMLGEMGRLHCQSCHNFLDRATHLVPSRRDCVDCHERRSVPTPPSASSSHMASLPCWSCHDPHRAERADATCADCHWLDLDAVGHREHRDTPCAGCHAGHEFSVTESTCDACHQLIEVTLGPWRSAYSRGGDPRGEGAR